MDIWSSVVSLVLIKKDQQTFSCKSCDKTKRLCGKLNKPAFQVHSHKTLKTRFVVYVNFPVCCAAAVTERYDSLPVFCQSRKCSMCVVFRRNVFIITYGHDFWLCNIPLLSNDRSVVLLHGLISDWRNKFRRCAASWWRPCPHLAYYSACGFTHKQIHL